MTLPVHWVETLAGVGPGDLAELHGDEAHHAVAVRRLRVGERMLLTDGLGTVVSGVAAEVGRRHLVVRADDVRRVPAPEPDVIVVQALPKGDRGELAVEMLTEVGVSVVVPWAAARSVAVWRGDRAAKSLARWRSTAREAAKQSRRVWFPEVAGLASTGEIVELLAGADLAIVLHEDADESFGSLEVPTEGSVVVVVGPEGGLTDDEVAGFRSAGGHVVRLGAEVLRTSTAGVAAVAAVLSRTERWMP
jgi:16S rRNA (uracil1498-N3)-methyltransferase